jgi:hypothetical protein
MKKLFKQQLIDFFLYLLHKNSWRLDFACEKQVRELIEKSVDTVERVSYKDCSKEEMRQFAKTNLAFLLTHMHIDAITRGMDYIDVTSLQNALNRYTCLWPFKGTEPRTLNHHNLPVRHINAVAQKVSQYN